MSMDAADKCETINAKATSRTRVNDYTVSAVAGNDMALAA
jgi:hypothetical protein